MARRRFIPSGDDSGELGDVADAPRLRSGRTGLSSLFRQTCGANGQRCWSFASAPGKARITSRRPDSSNDSDTTRALSYTSAISACLA